MNSFMLSIFIILSSVTGQFPTEFTNEQDSFDSEINYIDENTVYSDGFYLDANDFSIPNDKKSEENMDILSQVKVWNEDSGELYPYDSAKYDDDSVTYTYEDMSLTVEYDVFEHDNFSILDASSYFIQATYFNILKIVVASVVALIIIIVALFFIFRGLNKLIRKLTDIF